MENRRYYFLALGVIVTCVLSSIMLLLFDNIADQLKDARETEIETTSILSVTYQENVSGRFILGTGTIRGTEYYACYEQLEDGGIALLKLNAETTVIYQTLPEGEAAYVEKEVTKLGSIQSAKLYVPTNTVQKDYNLNLDS